MFKKRRRRRPAADPFIIIQEDTSKRGLNGPPPGIPILVSVPQAVAGPSGYPTTVTFENIVTKESYQRNKKTQRQNRRKKVNSRIQAQEMNQVPLGTLNSVQTPPVLPRLPPPEMGPWIEEFTAMTRHLTDDEFLEILAYIDILLPLPGSTGFFFDDRF